MSAHDADVIVVGGGIVGLATALALSDADPNARLLLLEKESELGFHQTGHNSGVIHSGIYYKPGSLKAKLAVAGNRSMAAFCREHGIPHEMCGKLIVAKDEAEIPGLRALASRATANEIESRWLTADEAARVEPHVRCAAALQIPSTGIVDYRVVVKTMAELLNGRGCEIRTSSEVVSADVSESGVRVSAGGRKYESGQLVSCGGLQSDRLATLAGASPGGKIVPFRGEYYELAADRRHLVRNLIYPVPNPEFPFLGVHFSRKIGGAVYAGPNAVLAFDREGYAKWSVRIRDCWDFLTYPGFWRFARRNWREGMAEMRRSIDRERFVATLQQMIPEVRTSDVKPAKCGIRAQALAPDGAWVDDFPLVRARSALHVCNAPSPAATASLEIGRAIARELLGPPTGASQSTQGPQS
jgi:L-2-hydroxyglutarate oxidase